MLQKWSDELKSIYNALEDEESKSIYKHRRLYSVLDDSKEISEMVYKCFTQFSQFSSDKICYYGAGGAGAHLIRHGPHPSFVIDKYKTGSISGYSIISLDEFLSYPDCREYLIIIMVCRPELRCEIQ